MLLKHGLAGTSYKASTGSAMAADTNALFWYAPDSVVESGGTISSWDDKVGTNDLGQVGSLSLPTYSAGGVQFTGSNIIGLTTFPYADSTRNEFRNGSGSYALFIVADLDISGQPASNEWTYITFRENLGTGEFDNSSMFSFITINTFGGSPTGAITHKRRGISDDSNQVPSALSVSAATAATATHVFRVSAVSGGNTDGEINDAAFTNQTATTTTSPSTGDGLFIGGFSDGTTLGTSGTLKAFVGTIYEVFATADVSASNLDAIHAELLTKYGI